MIKFTVTSEMRGKKIHSQADVNIEGRRNELVYEVALILREFDKLGDSILTDAFEIMFDQLKSEENE